MEVTRKTRIIVIAALVMFIMSALLPFFAVYPSQAQATEGFVSASAPESGRILICTSQGYKWVTAQQLQDEEHEPSHTKHLECALCFISANGLNHLLPPSYAVYPRVAKSKHIYHARNADITIRKLSALGYATRAPPLSA